MSKRVLQKLNYENISRTIDDVADFGVDSTGGNTRLGFQDEEDAVFDYFTKKASDAGFRVFKDHVGNLFIRYNGKTGFNVQTIKTGSHVDTVPNGGRYDGVLGVANGFEVLRAIKNSGVSIKNPIDLVLFRSEESAAFSCSSIGSKAATGKLSLNSLSRLEHNHTGQTLGDLLVARNKNPNLIRQRSITPENTKDYLELHIEQGPVLASRNLPLGIVTSIAAAHRFTLEPCNLPLVDESVSSDFVRYKVEVKGRFDHSGATPMGTDYRADAVVAGSQMITLLENCFYRVGNVDTPNGSVNKISGKFVFEFELPSSDTSQIGLLSNHFSEISSKEGCNYLIQKLDSDEIHFNGHSAGIYNSAKLVSTIRQICESHACESSVVGTNGVFRSNDDSTVLFFDLRSDDLSERESVVGEIYGSKSFNGSFKVVETEYGVPVNFSGPVISVLERACKSVGASYHLMPSGAGHDAMHMPNANMLFVRSTNGSHNPDETIYCYDDVKLAADASAFALLEMAGYHS